jgi:hypothetical protein
MQAKRAPSRRAGTPFTKGHFAHAQPQHSTKFPVLEIFRSQIHQQPQRTINQADHIRPRRTFSRMKLSRNKHPQASNGLHLAVLADVEDMGIQNTVYGEKRNLRLTFLVDEKDPHGDPLRVTDITTASYHPDSKLTGYVCALLGDEPGDDVETEDLINRCCRLTTELKANSKGKLYARIIAKEPLRPGERGPAIPLTFQRAETRPTRTAGSSAQRRPEVRPN